MKGSNSITMLNDKDDVNTDDKPGNTQSVIQRITSRLFSSASENNILLLPESVRYALSHSEGHIARQEIETILGNTRFQAIGLYLTLRYLQKTPQKRACLQDICRYLYDETNEHTYKKINEICLSYMITREKDSMLAQKLGYFSRIGFNTDQLFQKALDTTPLQPNVIPVISLYAGLLGLPVLAKNYPTRPIVFCDPKSGLLLGFNMGKEPILLTEISIEELRQYSGFAIIDDAIGSGETLEIIEGILKKGAVHEPIFTHIIAMKKFTS